VKCEGRATLSRAGSAETTNNSFRMPFPMTKKWKEQVSVNLKQIAGRADHQDVVAAGCWNCLFRYRSPAI
jgi:hypothetical protein